MICSLANGVNNVKERMCYSPLKDTDNQCGQILE